MTDRTRVYPKTAQYIPKQFPEMYREEGPNFIAFVKEYYRWKEEASISVKSRRILDNSDIDEAEESYLTHFMQKYMWGMPTASVNVRFLQKHVLDVYRSKGSVEGLRLLFRALYDKEATVYVPSKDMLAPSSGVFHQPRYMELTDSPHNASLAQVRVRGWESGATAIGERYVETVVRGRPSRALFVSNVVGDFIIGERVYADGIDPADGPTIVGSFVSFTPSRVLNDAELGDRYSDVNGFGSVKVSEISNLVGGNIVFSIVDGGSGYTLDAQVDVLAGALAAEDGDFLATEADEYIDVIVPGVGASFEVSDVSNLENIQVDVTIIAPYDGDTLDQATILYNLPIITEGLYSIMTEDGDTLITETTAGSTLNDDVIISDWESLETLTVGTISLISTLSAGANYIDNVTVIVTEPFISEIGIPDPDGGTYGTNADIEGLVTPSEDSATGYKVENSGFGYYDGERLSLRFSNDETVQTQRGEYILTEDGERIAWGDDDSVVLTGSVVLGSIGRQIGYWLDNNGQLNSNKVVQDSYYYQEYSYDVNTDVSIDFYEKTLRNVYHPTGVELFGTTTVRMRKTDHQAIGGVVVTEE